MSRRQASASWLGPKVNSHRPIEGLPIDWGATLAVHMLLAGTYR